MVSLQKGIYALVLSVIPKQDMYKLIQVLLQQTL